MTSKFVVNCKKWPYDVYIGRPSLGIRRDIPGSDGRWGNAFVVGVFIVVMLLIGLATTISSPAIAKKSGGKSLSQVPSTTPDFPGNDQKCCRGACYKRKERYNRRLPC